MDIKIGSDLVAPFLGAFFSFAFMRLTDYVKDYNEMLKEERRSITRVEREMLILVPRLHGNLDILKIYESTLKVFSERKLYNHVPDLFDVDLKIEKLEGIRNLDIVNDVMQLNIFMSFHHKSLGELRDQMRMMLRKIDENLDGNKLSMNVAETMLRSIPNLLESIARLSETTIELIDLGKVIQAQIRLERRLFLLSSVFYRAKRNTKERLKNKIAAELLKMDKEAAAIIASRKIKPIEGDQVLNAFKNHPSEKSSPTNS